MKDLKYIIKRIIIGTGIALALMLIKSNVFALNCENGTWDIGYKKNNSWDTATVTNRIIPDGVYELRYYYSSNNLAGKSFNFTTTIGMRLFGYSTYSPVPTISFYYGGNFNNYCTYSVNKSNKPATQDDLVRTEYLFFINCNYPLTSNTSNTIRMDITLPYSTISDNFGNHSNMFAKTTNQSTCMIYSPDNTSILIENDNANANKINNSINDVNNTLNDDNIPDSGTTSDAYDDFNDYVATNGVITSLVLLPVNLFTNVLTSLNSNCVRFSLGSLLGTSIYFDCIDPSDFLGSTLWNVIDVLCSGFFVYHIAQQFIKVFHNLTQLKDGDPIGD